MLDKIVPFFQLIIGNILVIPVVINLLFKREHKLINILMINNIVYTVGILLTHSVHTIELSTFWLPAIIVYLILTFAYYYVLNLTPIGMLVSNIIVSLIMFMLPFEKLSMSLFNMNQAHFMLIIVLSLLIILTLVTKEKKQILRLYYFGIAIIASSITFLEAPYSMMITCIIAIIFAVISCQKVVSSQQQAIEKMNKKLEKLESEFSDELRREVNKHTFHLKEVQEKMSEINKIDNLTKAYNRKAIFDFIEKQTQDRRLKEFSIIMFDLDHFKKLNDTKGHVQGDIALKMLAQIARECLRETDTLGRYGGDEFLIVLPDANVEVAKRIANRFRIQIDQRSRPHYTLSMGVAHYPTDGETLAKLLISADNSLYEAKRTGRNKVAYKPK